MKRIKKLASLLLAMVMVLTMALPAMAAENVTQDVYKITLKQNTDDKTEHQYAAYQIFAGDLAKVDGELVLSNIIWGSGVERTDDLLKKLIEDKDDVFSDAFDACETAADVARALSEFSDTFNEESGALDYFANIAEKYLSATYESATGTGDVVIEVYAPGYYLVKDTTKSVESNGAYTRFLLKVVGDSTANIKSEVPSGDKQIFYNGLDAFNDENGKYDPTNDKNLAASNNAGIGEHVGFQITSEVPNWAGYDYYFFIMNDTMSKGLTFDKGSIEVKIGGKVLEDGKDYNVKYDVPVDPNSPNGDKTTFELAFVNIMNYNPGEKIIVTYSAQVNENAIIGTSGNENKWALDYSRNPNISNKELMDDTNPGFPKDDVDTSDIFGKTPEKKTLTFVTELDITKYANDKEHFLPGAEFTLTGTSYQVVVNHVEYYEADANGDHYRINDGTYTDKPPVEDKKEYVSLGIGTQETTEGYLKNDEGEYYVPSNSEEYDGKEIFKLVETKGTVNQYEKDENGTVQKYTKKTSEEIQQIKTPVYLRYTVPESGIINFKGLGAGKYTLTETVTPAGYNTIEPIEFEITFTAPDRGVVTGQETCTWDLVADESFEYSETGNDDSLGGVFKADIINKSGSLLPSTGGIGTTIFYVVGAVLVIGAGILLVAKKRMSAR